MLQRPQRNLLEKSDAKTATQHKCFQRTLKIDAHVLTRLLLTRILTHSTTKVLFLSVVLEKVFLIYFNIVIAWFRYWYSKSTSITSVFLMCRVVVFAACFLNAAHVLSNWWRCFLNLLVFCLIACVFLSCSAVSSQGHRRSALYSTKKTAYCYNKIS